MSKDYVESSRLTKTFCDCFCKDLKPFLSGIEETLKRIESKVDAISCPTESDEDMYRVKSYRPIKKEAKLEVSSPVIYNGIDLTGIYASKTSPQKYARKVVGQLFSKKELSHSIFRKVGPTSRKELSPTRCNIVTNCLEKLYFKEMLERNEMVIRESLSQKCREATVAVKLKSESDGLAGTGHSLYSSGEDD
ncbi:uncharacterized protein LOC134185951 [Corticium candelabrum]|uniref:uncharacterized protein LOC134185951 n=1 Tax=Corticium candelabrum TaxID=121492 RepID=UPI002E268C60|nr:uncharacterized protein LOC134185951 [Corticium candelabrum]XP_062509828.1 uncharacterized protein LOC134185951 [Corticium candelabrum]